MKSEELMARVMNHLADKYKTGLILKGGMLLRLLNSPRSTQDLDYCWISDKKRNRFGEELKKNLEKLEGVKVTAVQVNSRGIFLEVADRNSDALAKLEINVVDSMRQKPQAVTTAPISAPYALQPRIISAMDLSEAFSNKIAAALERDLVRDLYDLMQFETMANFDRATLNDRLSRLEIGRKKPRACSDSDAAGMLREKIESLSEKRIKEELGAILPPGQAVGLMPRIRAAVGRIIQKMEAMPPAKT